MGLDLQEDEDTLKHQEHREPKNKDKLSGEEGLRRAIKRFQEEGQGREEIELQIPFLSDRELLKLITEDPLKHKDYRDFSIAGKEHGQDDFDALVRQGRELQEGIRSLFLHREKRFKYLAELNHEVCVHTEIIKPDAPKGQESGIVGEMMTENKGKFKLELPRFYGDCVFFLAARDTSLWDSKKRKLWKKESRNKNWIQMEDDEFKRLHEDAEFYVRLNFPYPRWPQPYNWYHTNYATHNLNTRKMGDLEDRVLNEITIRSKRNGLRHMNLSQPVYVVDAYEAFNQTMDAGLLTQPYFPISLIPEWEIRTAADYSMAIAYNYISDMNMKRMFDFSLFYDSLKVYSLQPNTVGNNLTHASGDVMLQDAKEWINYVISSSESRHNAQLQFLDKIYIYTDFSPRNEGCDRYRQDDQPSVEVSLHRLPENERRVTYRDRRYILHGFAYQEDFYHPDYSRQRPQQPTDYRRTLYWNPNLKLDEQGQAHITLYNNCRQTQIYVEGEGMGREGQLLYNK